MRRADRSTARMRARAVLVLLTAVVAFVSASLRAPRLVLLQYAVIASVVGARDGGEERPELVAESIELGQVPAVRASRGDPPRPRTDGAFGALVATDSLPRVPSATPRSADAPRIADGTWTKPAKTHVELMVFLN